MGSQGRIPSLRARSASRMFPTCTRYVYVVRPPSSVVSVALLLMRRLPEEVLPVGDLGLHRADAIEEGREIGDAMRPRRELEAGIIEQGEEFIDAFGRILRLLPQYRGGALVRIGDIDRLLQRGGDRLEQRGIALLGLLRRQ